MPKHNLKKYNYPFLDALLTLLEAEGFEIGVDTLVRLEKAWLVFGEKYYRQPEKLKHILAPLIATSPPQQKRFYGIFDDYYKHTVLVEVEKAEAENEEPDVVLPVDLQKIQSGETAEEGGMEGQKRSKLLITIIASLGEEKTEEQLPDKEELKKDFLGKWEHWKDALGLMLNKWKGSLMATYMVWLFIVAGIAALLHYFDLLPDNLTRFSGKVEQHITAAKLNEEGIAFLKNNQLDSAVLKFNGAVKEKSDYKIAQYNAALIAYQKGMEAYQNSKTNRTLLDTAIHYFEQAEAADMDTLLLKNNARHNLGMCYKLKGDSKNAIDYYNKIALKPYKIPGSLLQPNLNSKDNSGEKLDKDSLYFNRFVPNLATELGQRSMDIKDNPLIKAGAIPTLRSGISPDASFIYMATTYLDMELSNQKTGQKADENDVLLRHPFTYDILLRFDKHQARIQYLEASPDGNRMISIGRNGQVFLWNSRNGKVIKEWQDKGVIEIHFSPGADKLIGGFEGGKVKVWNGEGELIKEWYVENKADVYQTRFNHGGDNIITLAKDSTDNIVLWDAESYEKTAVYSFDNASVFNALFSLDDQQLWVCGKGGIMVWDLRSGKQLAKMETEEVIWTMDFLPDGQYLLTGGGGQ